MTDYPIVAEGAYNKLRKIYFTMLSDIYIYKLNVLKTKTKLAESSLEYIILDTIEETIIRLEFRSVFINTYFIRFILTPKDTKKELATRF